MRFSELIDGIAAGPSIPPRQDPRDLQPRTNIEGSDGVLQQRSRNPGVHQRAQKHITADSGKTLKVGYAHKNRRWPLVVSRWPKNMTGQVATGLRTTNDQRRTTIFSS